MIRRILITAIAVAGVTGAMALHTRPLHANDAIYQLTSDKYGNSICGGQCQKGCCRIIPL